MKRLTHPLVLLGLFMAALFGLGATYIFLGSLDAGPGVVVFGSGNDDGEVYVRPGLPVTLRVWPESLPTDETLNLSVSAEGVSTKTL